MKAWYQHHPDKGPEYAVFRIPRLSVETGLSCRFALARPDGRGGQQFLQPDGWNDTEHLFIPNDVLHDKQDLLLAVGPEVTPFLEAGHNYTLLLFPADSEPFKIMVECPETSATSEKLLPPLSHAQDDPLSMGEQYLSLSRPTEKKQPGRKLVPLLLLLLVIAAGMFWFMGRDGGMFGGTGSVTGSVGTEHLSPLERARSFLRAEGSPEGALDLSMDMPDTPEGRDASFILLEWAAEQGQKRAMLLTGFFYDPLDTAPKGSIVPDIEQAWMWYAQADKAGIPEAGPRLATLRQYLEKESVASREIRELLTRLSAWRP